MSEAKQFDCILHEYDDGTYIASPALTSDGVQDSDAKDTTTQNVNITVYSARIDPMRGSQDTVLLHELKGLYFILEAWLRSVSTATADLVWKWQAKNAGSTTWVDLHEAVTETNIGAAYVQRIRRGYFRPITNLDSLPIDVRLVLQCNELNEGRGKVSGRSLVTVKVVE